MSTKVNNSWQNSYDKLTMLMDVQSGFITHNMDAQAAQQLQVKYKKMSLSIFRSWLSNVQKEACGKPATNNTNNITNLIVTEPTSILAVGWRKSAAKKLLHDDVVSGWINREMPAKQAQTKRHEYLEMDATTFANRLRSVRKQVYEKEARAAEDADAYAHDRQLYPIMEVNAQGLRRWHGSQAHKQLIQDMDNNLHITMKPGELYNTREAYKQFSLDKFREHIYQEKRRRRYCAQSNLISK